MRNYSVQKNEKITYFNSSFVLSIIYITSAFFYTYKGSDLSQYLFKMPSRSQIFSVARDIKTFGLKKLNRMMKNKRLMILYIENNWSKKSFHF